MKTIFRLYNSLNSSYFSLINGDRETQQTKGLGLLFSKSELALKTFLEIREIANKIGEINLSEVDKVVVNCELISKKDTKYRADIVIRLYKDKKPYKSIVIEAKSINKANTIYETNNQIKNYILNDVFSELAEFKDKCFGVTLTKLPSYVNNDILTSITWSDLIYSLIDKRGKDGLLDDYFNFITNIDGGMKFYEQEVYSIPTAEWSQNALNNFFVYECPNQGRYLIKQKPLFLTFRKNGGGEMDKLYKVEDIIILNFKYDLLTFLEDVNYSEEIRERVRLYDEYMLNNVWGVRPDDDKQVFILSKNTIELKNKPKPIRNNSFRAYYELADVLNKKYL